MWNHMWGYDGAWGPGMHWGWIGLSHVLWWVLVVVAVVVMVRIVAGDRRSGDRALDILRERYARGEIDQAEYDERKRQLKA